MRISDWSSDVCSSDLGLRGVNETINRAKPFPVKGLYNMADFPDAPPVRGMDTGIACLDGMMQIVLGTLTVFTGYANMGKSTVVTTILAHCVANNVKSEEHTSELQPLMRIPYYVFCWKKK